MIATDITTTKQTLDLAKAKTEPSQKGGYSFADLLRGVSHEKEGSAKQEKEPLLETKQGGTPTKKENPLMTLLKGNRTAEGVFAQMQEAAALSGRQNFTLSLQEMRELIGEAKNYLKEQILQSEGYKKAQVLELPKTLRGLAKMAQTFGIDVSKISLQEGTTLRQNAEFPRAQTTALPLTRQEQATSYETPKKESANLADLLQVKKAQKKPHANEAPKEDLRKEPLKLADLLQAKESTKTSLETPQEQHAKVIPHVAVQKVVTPQERSQAEKTASEKAQDSLRALLRGDKESVQQASVVTPLSVEAAKVLTSSESARPERTLESLLRMEGSTASMSEENLVKTDGALKAESLEVKINEAKQMIKYLSSDIKQTIDEYKSPFTRVKLQLNPQRLGEVDVTVVQRGNNLHVNLSSNNAAINTLALHANELRQQLQNSGINNATLNFNNQSDNGGGSQGGEHQRHQEQKGHKTYQTLAQEENREEILSSLEIVVPRYI
jgi:hypothetical protein